MPDTPQPSTPPQPARTVSDSRVVAAPPEVVWDILTDPARHSEIDGSGTVRGAIGSRRLSGVGDTFGMRMRLGVPYPIRNTVVEYEPLARIAWRHAGRHRWRYELEAVDGGTRVTETFDYRPALLRALYDRIGIPELHRGNIARTLERLADVAAADAARA